jgi:hypothetical protein
MKYGVTPTGSIEPPRSRAARSSFESASMRSNCAKSWILLRICQRQSFHALSLTSGKNARRKRRTRALVFGLRLTSGLQPEIR